MSQVCQQLRRSDSRHSATTSHRISWIKRITPRRRDSRRSRFRDSYAISSAFFIFLWTSHRRIRQRSMIFGRGTMELRHQLHSDPDPLSSRRIRFLSILKLSNRTPNTPCTIMQRLTIPASHSRDRLSISLPSKRDPRKPRTQQSYSAWLRSSLFFWSLFFEKRLKIQITSNSNKYSI